MSVLADVGFFALLFFVLVFIHELGHFLMAKWVGIRVEKFSIGMGPKLFAFTRGETEYRIGLLPLGGYVKMSGDDPSKTYEGEEAARGFLTQRPPQKLLVVFGGPVFNLILPIFLFAALLAVGNPSVAPVIGTLVPDMPGAAAGLQPGDRVLQVNGKPVYKWTELEAVVQKSPNMELKIEGERPNFATQKMESFSVVATPKLADGKSKFGEDVQIGRLGISPEFFVPLVFFEGEKSLLAQAGFEKFDRVRKVNGFPISSHDDFVRALQSAKAPRVITIERQGELKEVTLPSVSGAGSVYDQLGFVAPFLVVGFVDENSPAFRAGIRKDDRLISIDGKKLSLWEEVSIWIKGSEGKALKIQWSRNGVVMEAEVVPEKTTINDPLMGKDNPAAREPAYRIGVGSAAMQDNEFYVEHSLNPIDWVTYGFKRTWEMTTMTVEALGKLVTGQLSLKLLGSPIMIYKVAGNSYRMAGGGKHGWISFFNALALLSISLGLFNLLPIPVLDGGHATFFLIEWIRGKPLSLKVLEMAMQVGMFAIITLIAFVLYNDFYRYGFFDAFMNLFRKQ
jgi:regulator of sigma E protease